MRIPRLFTFLISLALATTPSLTALAVQSPAAPTAPAAKPASTTVSVTDTEQYAAREAQDPSAQDFEGGNDVVIIGASVTTLVVVVAVVVLLVILL